ncbi:MAG TPA: DUF5329 family protein, partial [Deltaproteobacteria bacterium]|nr:DUF5329 family protein [Deltaproteobacteria bacterium]
MKRTLYMVGIILAFTALAAFARDAGEQDRIEFLIYSVENLKGALFIRNGAPHDGKEAADHLRMKLQKAGSRVKTADDFIRLCASASSMTGRPYMIRLPDGTVIGYPPLVDDPDVWSGRFA